MAKRISLKGKGADIFFGEYSPPPPAGTAAEDMVSVEDPLTNRAVIPGSGDHQESPNHSMQESMHARKQDSIEERVLPIKDASTLITKKAIKKGAAQTSSEIDQPSTGPVSAEVLDAIWRYVSERANNTNAFRYTDLELSQLTDVIYEITKRHTIKLSKQDVARLGLNAVLWDYKNRGDSSLLGGFAIRRKQASGRG